MSKYTHDDATHVSKNINYTPDIIIQGVCVKNLYKHSQLCRYNIYQLTIRIKEDGEPDISYGILESDFRKYWRIHSKNSTPALSDADSVDVYTILDETTIKKAHNHKPSSETGGIETYFMQRTLWPDDDVIPTRPVKKIEYETAFQLFLKLSDRMVITHQKSILNIRVDMIFELRDSLDLDIPSIGIEINEDGHKTYNKEDEQKRADVIKYFDNILYVVDIKRGSTLAEIKTAVNETAKNIIQKADDMLITYNPNISPKELENELLKNDFANHIVGQFLSNHNTGDKVFCLRHDIVGEYLGYSNTETYKRFKGIITGTKNKPSKFIPNIDYKIVSLKSISSVDRRPSTLEISINNPKNDRGKSEKTKIVLFTRSTYHRICCLSNKPKALEISDSFCKMYEILFKYIIATRSSVVQQNRDNKTREPVIKERVQTLVLQRTKKTNYDKIEKELENVNKKYEVLYKNMEKKDKKIKEYKETNKDLLKKVGGMVLLSASLDEYKKKYECMNDRKTKYMNRYRTTKTELDEKTQNLNDSEHKLKKYIKKNQSHKKYEDKINKYSYIIKELEKSIADMNIKHNKYRNKIIKMSSKIKKLTNENTKLREENAKLKEKTEKVTEKVTEKKTEKKTEKVTEIPQQCNYTKIKMQLMTKVELKDLCRSKGIGGYSKFGKSELIEFMLTNPKMK